MRDHDLFALAVLYFSDTGLPVTVWLRPGGHSGDTPRVLVARLPGGRENPDDLAVMRIQPEPALIEGDLHRRILEPVARWIGLNTAALLRYWEGDIGTGRLMRELRPLA